MHVLRAGIDDLDNLAKDISDEELDELSCYRFFQSLLSWMAALLTSCKPSAEHALTLQDTVIFPNLPAPRMIARMRQRDQARYNGYLQELTAIANAEAAAQQEINGISGFTHLLCPMIKLN